MSIFRAAQRLILSIAVLVACCASAFAQDAGQVLRVSVGYGTLKNTVSMTPEKKADVERLEALARTANSQGKYGDALKHLYHAMALMRGTEWTSSNALSSALTVKLDRMVLEPGESVKVRLGQIYALDEPLQGKLSGAIQLVSADQSQQVKASKPIGPIDADFIAQPFTAEMTLPEVEDGNYRISVRLEPANSKSDPIVKNTTVRIARGLAAQVAAAKARAAKTEATLKGKRKEALLAALPSAQYRIALVDMANAGEISFDKIDFGAELKEATAILAALDAANDPFDARRGDFRKAYRSKVDNSLQPYRIFVPSSYDSSKRSPLIIALHGMGGDENSYFEAYAKGAFKVEAERRGYIVACPKGRKPASMYVGDAEKDVMDVVAEVRRDYNIDPDRIYLTGHSMGGFGTWSVAIDHPDIFAALAPIAGGVANPQSMAKIAHVPQIVVHGDNDKTVPVERSRVMVAEGKKLGVEMRYIEVPGGSHIDVVVPTFKDVFDWFDTHRRKTAEAKAGAAASKSK
ncbi:MAG TPA: prolyl oligopeptidase family serine peptidase [Blastocatellia bacterium]|nr:prolyl oligopeptidase family serine peptidase [Blastocatellia bacterium]